MAQMRPVIGRFTAREQNRERLEALGTMAAGLAHELNNPAAAARRTASELADALEVLSNAFGVFVKSGLDMEHKQRLLELQTRAIKRLLGANPALGARRGRRRGRADRRAHRRRRRAAVAPGRDVRLSGSRRRLRGRGGRRRRRRGADGAALDLGVAVSSPTRRRARRVNRPDGTPASRRSSPTPTWTVAKSSRSTFTRGSKRR